MTEHVFFSHMVNSPSFPFFAFTYFCGTRHDFFSFLVPHPKFNCLWFLLKSNGYLKNKGKFYFCVKSTAQTLAEQKIIWRLYVLENLDYSYWTWCLHLFVVDFHCCDKGISRRKNEWIGWNNNVDKSNFPSLMIGECVY